MARSSPELTSRRGKGRLPDLTLNVQYPGGSDDAPSRSDVRRWVRATCTTPAVVTVRFVDEIEAQTLNASYRDKDYATNVLSFPYTSGGLLAGDLVLCKAVVAREALAQRKLLNAHYAHLVVHGLLHLQGFDHERSAKDAKIMEAKEIEILASLEISDPYN
ncbi:MAG: rRNA maturation RNase YbeY [Rhodocyclaceae bacterium]|nr:rRNA maturation RNase YbeY [Rhodocyclaceae bacterium]